MFGFYVAMGVKAALLFAVVCGFVQNNPKYKGGAKNKRIFRQKF